MPSLPLSAPSERRVRSGGVAALLPAGLSPMSQSQLRSSPGRGGGRPDAGCGGAAELRAAAPRAVAVLDLLLGLRLVRALRCLLEHLRLRPARRATAPDALTGSSEAAYGPHSLYS